MAYHLTGLTHLPCEFQIVFHINNACISLYERDLLYVQQFISWRHNFNTILVDMDCCTNSDSPLRTGPKQHPAQTSNRKILQLKKCRNGLQLQIPLFILWYVKEDTKINFQKKFKCTKPFCRNINFHENKWRPCNSLLKINCAQAPALNWTLLWNHRNDRTFILH